MLFAHYDRYRYQVSPLVEVICQVRFPEIPALKDQAPVAYQEAVRQHFPKYSSRKEQPQPRVVGLGGPSPKVETPEPVINHAFLSEDGLWRVNLTSNYIALSTLAYGRWENFARQLDLALAAFIQVYHPETIDRVGLRYLNAFSRRAMGHERTPWVDLFQPALLGVLAEPDVEEKNTTRATVDAKIRLEDGCDLKLHAGPGLLRGGKTDPELKFILDGDFARRGNLAPAEIAAELERLHRHAICLFRGAMTSTLHTALKPEPLD